MANYDYKAIAIALFPALLSLVLVILSGVSYGSVSKMDESTKQRDAKRSSSGILLISIAMLLYFGYMLYDNKDVLKPKTQFVYYF